MASIDNLQRQLTSARKALVAQSGQSSQYTGARLQAHKNYLKGISETIKDLEQRIIDQGGTPEILDPFSGLEKSEAPTEPILEDSAGGQQVQEAPTAPAPSAPAPNLFDPPAAPTPGTAGGGSSLGGGSTARITTGTTPEGESTAGQEIGGIGANVNQVAQDIGGDIPSAGQIVSDVAGSILQTRSNLESLINRKKRVGFSETRIAAQDESLVARRTLLEGSKQAEALAASKQGAAPGSEGTVKAEELIKGKGKKVGTILGRRK